MFIRKDDQGQKRPQRNDKREVEKRDREYTDLSDHRERRDLRGTGPRAMSKEK